MRAVRLLLCAGVLASVGCSSIGNRIVHSGYFIGVRGDADLIVSRDSARKDAMLGAFDLPFSFVGDLLFLPYDAVQMY